MNRWGYVIVKYGGDLVGCDYVGGAEQITHIARDPTSIVDLRYNINNILQCNSMNINYDIYLLSRSTHDHIRKTILSTDEQLTHLFAQELNPIVHVVHHTLHSTNLDESLEQIRRVASSEWFNDDYVVAENYVSMSRQTEPHYVYDEDTQHVAHEVSDEKDDTDESYQLESESEASDDQTEENLKNFSFAEFAAWINREGGMAKLLDLVHGRSEDPAGEDTSLLEPDEQKNWLVPVIPLDATASIVGPEEEPNFEELKKGSIFSSKTELNLAVGLWHMEKRAEYTVQRSDQRRLVWKCKTSNRCPFTMRATNHSGAFWGVHTFNGEHTCINDLGYTAPRKVHAKVVAAYYARKMKRDREMIKPRDIMDELQVDYGIRVNYDVALKARHAAIERIYGNYDQSYQMLPSYLHMLKEMNPGTHTDLDVAPDGRFRHLFVALGATRITYSFCMRPIIVVDGTHLKGKNRGILFVAVTKDANERVYPLAYGVGPIENDESWIWFLSRVRTAYGCIENTLIVSDQHKSIANAVKEVFPEATHATCYYHLLQNMKSYGKMFGGLFQRAAYAYQHEDFQLHLNYMKAYKPSAYEHLMRVGPEKWARCKCPIRRYSFMTSSIAEAFNARLLWARRLPIVANIEAIRIVIEKWFDERRQTATNSDAPLSEEVMRKIKIQIEKSRIYTCVRIDNDSFKVDNGRVGYVPKIVSLHSRACSCRLFDLDGMPCAHAIAVIQANGVSILDYVDDFYKRHALIESYKYPVRNVPKKNEWILPPCVTEQQVFPPIVVRQAGRPRMSRIRGGGERSTRRAPHIPEESSGIRRRAPKTCGRCHRPGHTRKTCSNLE